MEHVGPRNSVFLFFLYLCAAALSRNASRFCMLTPMLFASRQKARKQRTEPIVGDSDASVRGEGA
jgi:phosphoribosylpyrophosphate synthetase